MSLIPETTGAIGEMPVQVLDQTKKYIPEGAIYKNLQPVAVGSRADDLIINASADTYSPGSNNQVIFNLPSGDHFIDTSNSYMTFTVTNNNNTTGGALLFDNSALGLFDRFTLTVSGTQVEDISAYNVWCNVLMAAKADPNYRMFAGSHMGTGTTIAGPATNHADLAAYVAATHYKGATIAANGASLTVSIPLVSGVFSQSKLLPMFAMGQTQAIWYLAQNGMVSAGDACNYNLSAVRLVLRKVTMEPAVVNKLKAEISRIGAIQLGYTSVQNFSDSSASGNTLNVKADARKKSIKSAFTVLRTQANIESLTANKYSSFIRNGITKYTYSVNGMYYPSQGVLINSTNHSEALTNLKRCFSHLSDAKAQGIVNQYNIVSNAHGGVGGDYAIMAYDFQSVDGLQSGLDTKQSASPINVELVRSGGGACRVDVFCVYDGVLTLLPGGNCLVMD